MTTKYKLKRRASLRGLRTRHGMVGAWVGNFVTSLRAGFFLIVSLLLGLFAWNTSVLSETVVAEAETRDKIEQVVMSCLQHGAAFINGELHLCRPANTWVKK